MANMNPKTFLSVMILLVLISYVSVVYGAVAATTMATSDSLDSTKIPEIQVPDALNRALVEFALTPNDAKGLKKPGPVSRPGFCNYSEGNLLHDVNIFKSSLLALPLNEVGQTVVSDLGSECQAIVEDDCDYKKCLLEGVWGIFVRNAFQPLLISKQAEESASKQQIEEHQDDFV